MESKALELIKKSGLTCIMLCPVGSRLHGTETKDSDWDYKGVFMPPAREILLGKIKKSVNLGKINKHGERNTKDSIDLEMYSLHHFLSKARMNETNAMDMLHCPKEKLVISSNLWECIYQKRAFFYSKKMAAYTGMAKRQFRLYTDKKEKLDTAILIRNFLKEYPRKNKLGSVWDDLPLTKHSLFAPANGNIMQYEVCGKIIPETVTISYAIGMLDNIICSYGERVKKLPENGKDWKSISHALRAAFQAKELLVRHDLTFPLFQAAWLTDVKKGEVEFQTVLDILKTELDEINIISEQSSLPENVDMEYWDNFLFYWMYQHIISTCEVS